MILFHMHYHNVVQYRPANTLNGYSKYEMQMGVLSMKLKTYVYTLVILHFIIHVIKYKQYAGGNKLKVTCSAPELDQKEWVLFFELST